MNVEGIAIFLQSNPGTMALAVFGFGIIVALLAAYGIGRLGTWIQNVDGYPGEGETQAVNIRLIRKFVFWVIIAITVLVTLRVIQPQSWQAMAQTFFDMAGGLLFGLVVLFIGYGISRLARQMLEGIDVEDAAPLLPGLTQGLILLLSGTVALEQMGINMTVVTNTLVVILAVVVASLGLAFALGARPYVANLTASAELSRLSVGDWVEIDGYQGQVVHLHKTSFELATEDGTLSIPSSWLLDHAILKRSRPSHG